MTDTPTITASTHLKDAALRLKQHLFGSRYDLGFVGVGSGQYLVFVHGTQRQWQKRRIISWEGVPVVWRYQVGPAKAGLNTDNNAP